MNVQGSVQLSGRVHGMQSLVWSWSEWSCQYARKGSQGDGYATAGSTDLCIPLGYQSDVRREPRG